MILLLTVLVRVETDAQQKVRGRAVMHEIGRRRPCDHALNLRAFSIHGIGIVQYPLAVQGSQHADQMCARRTSCSADSLRIAAPAAVFFNDGSGRHFTEVRFGDDAYGFALGDLNGDRYPDIALARTGAPNVMYINGK